MILCNFIFYTNICYFADLDQSSINNFMHYSSQDQLPEKRDRFFNRDDLEGLSPEEREFAEQQFRLIYAQEMSRFTAEMSHKKKVLENLNTLDVQESKNQKEQLSKLKNKMASIEENRNKKLEQKIKSCKQNDERWFHKLKEIQNKFKLQNKEAIEKAKKYREESETYWKNKEKKLTDISRTNFQHSRATKNNEDKSLHRSFLVEKQKSKTKLIEIDNPNQRFTINHNNELQKSQRQPSQEKHELDTIIRMHKQRSDQIQKEKEGLVFQKALEKLEKIEKTRAKVNKDNEPKVGSPTKPKVVDYTHSSMHHKNRDRNFSLANKTLKREPQQKDSLQKLIKDHLQTKQRLQQQQFMQRGQLLENSIQKSRKQKIMRMIKHKVQEIKLNSMMREGSIN